MPINMVAWQNTVGVARSLVSVAFATAGVAAAVLPSDFKEVRVIETVTVIFPEELLHKSVYDGEAKVIMEIDADGRLADWLMRSYSHPLLARAATDALQQWRFEPAQVRGQRVDTRVEFAFSFHASGTLSVVRSPDLPERVRPTGAQYETRRIFSARELDEPLAVLKAVRPLSMKATGPHVAGKVTVDFYVDEQGRTRMPVVQQADDLSFAEAAVEAINHWQFSVPKLNGLPVTTHAIQVFFFDQID